MAIQLFLGAAALADHPFRSLQARVSATAEGLQLRAARAVYFAVVDGTFDAAARKDLAHLLRAEAVDALPAQAQLVL
ncbi:MAG: hypothetical protein ACPHCJ_11485, partial [Oceanococcaceae bacterium]